MNKFIVVDRFSIEARAFDTASTTALFFLARSLHDYIVVKDENRVVKLMFSDLRDIERQLEIA
jgi:hypothetical protein